MKHATFLAMMIALGALTLASPTVNHASGSQGMFSLKAFDGSGDDLGMIKIYINPAGNGVREGYGWEWKGNDINEGGTYRWSHTGTSFILNLLSNGSSFATVTSPWWDMPTNSKGEPPRPWFSTQGANAGVGSIAQGKPGLPAKLITGFNWQLR